MIGDFEEIYNEMARNKGSFSAKIWYWSQIILTFPSFMKNSIYWGATMFTNYFKIALRFIKKHKVFSFINISGLAISTACCLFIALWIFDELSFDKFHADSGQIYQALGNGRISSTPMPLAAALEETFPEVIYASRYERMGRPLFRREDKVFSENGVVVVDPDFFKIFSFPFLEGDPNTVLDDIYSIVISEQIANKFFPGENPLGKALTMNDDLDFIVTGVMQDIPQNSTLQFNIAIHFDIRISYFTPSGADTNSYGWWSPNTFLKLQKDVSLVAFNQKITKFFLSKIEGDDESLSALPFTARRFFFWNTQQFITIYSVIAIFIVIMSCINFINLSTARSAKRACEIGIRKVSGAIRRNLIFQFLGESFLLTITALAIALLIVSTLLPIFNSLTGKQIATGSLSQPSILLIIVGLVLFTAIASGSYPALILSSFKPVQVLKGRLNLGSSGSVFRKILVVIQFSISIILIIGAGIIYKQLNYIKTKDIGYAKDQLITISLKGESRRSYDILKSRLNSDSRILGVTGMADDLPNFGSTSSTAEWEGKDMTKEIHVGFNFVDYDVAKTLGIELVEGRDFSREFMADAESGYLVNEELVKLMGLESVVGRPFKEFGKAGRIIGVFKNTHFLPLTNQINPLYFQLNPERINHLVIRVPTEKMQATIQFIKETWEEIIPMYPFEFRFVDDDFNLAYINIERMSRLANVFTLIAIFIACLGLFGLASFTAEQRSKEIGIRKVLGASMPGIVVLLSKEFTKWVLIANVIGWPLAYFVMNRWLQNFAYRVNIGIDIFILSGLSALVIALIAVSYQTIKAATSNPVDSLRYE
jgi:putative ABC transport system permease protein